MSALDLFASALGAFILIAIVIFPYFPNTNRAAGGRPPPVPAPPPPVPAPAVERQLEEIRRQLAEAQSLLAEAREEARGREEIRDRLVEVERELSASRARLADAAADARDLEEIRDRLVVAQGRLATAQERERNLQTALQDERRRKFLLITISWDRDDDVDLHIVAPGGREYYYGARRHAGSPAQFEEDTTDGPGNEVWLHPRVEPGEYAVYYNLFSKQSNAVDVRGAAVHSDGREELPDVRLSREGEKPLVANVIVDQNGTVQVR